ncbi:unnamed protein product, partial [Polarella glacialis]
EQDAQEQQEVERAHHHSSYLPQLIHYVDWFVPRLDRLAPLLPLVRPHLPYIMPYLDRVLPYIENFANFPVASANADVVIGYFGWMLRVPFLPRIMNLPWVPRIIASLSTVLPRWPIRWALERKRRRREGAQLAALKNTAFLGR